MECVSLHVSTSANKACITSNPSLTPRSVSFIKPANFAYSLIPSKSNALNTGVPILRSMACSPSTTLVDLSKICLVSRPSDLSFLEVVEFYYNRNGLLFLQGNSSRSKAAISSPVIVTCLPNEKLSATAQNPFDSEEARRDGSKFCYEPWIRRVCILVIGVHVILVCLPLVKPHINKVYYLLKGAPVSPEPVRAVVGRVARTLVTRAFNVCAWTVNMRAGGVTNNALISIGTINYNAPGQSIWDLIPALILLLQEARMYECKKKHA